MKRTPINPMSKKRKKVQKKRRSFVAEILRDRPDCEAGATIFEFYKNKTITRANIGCMGTACSSEVHEPLTRARAPGSETILDPKNAVALCSACHRWIHDNVAEATELELLVSVGLVDENFPKIFKRRGQ